MADSRDIDTLSSELESRLDDLFGENDIQLPDTQEKSLKEHYPLAELKNLILSIDWEITDEVLDKLIQQLKDLQLTYKHDKIVMTFLQILNSLGNYIKTHRAKAHPKTFKILNSVFSNLDKVVLTRDMPEAAKKKILRAEMNRYKELRNQIAKSKRAAAERRAKAKTMKPEVAEAAPQKEEPVLKLDEPVPAPESEEMQAAPAIVLEEPTPEATAAKPKEEPVLDLYEPSEGTAEAKSKEEPVLDLHEPSEGTAEAKPKEEPVLDLYEPSEGTAEAKPKEEPDLELVEPSEGRVDAESKDETVLGLDQTPVQTVDAAEEENAVAIPSPDLAAAGIAEAVEEIKRCIHTEIKALKEEIRSLKKQL